jgi:hypothetical protein
MTSIAHAISAALIHILMARAGSRVFVMDHAGDSAERLSQAAVFSELRRLGDHDRTTGNYGVGRVSSASGGKHGGRPSRRYS